MLGFGLGLTHFGTRGGVSDTPDSSVSGAALMLASEPEGFAIDFSDASICIKDLTTPANSFASQGTVLNGALVGPGAKITYASPSPKLCKKSDGTYGYRAQNLYLNSESPANQSVTVVSGLPYIIAVTGTVSITLSGAAIGTVTAGNPITFTASTGTLTCGSTSGAGTVHLRSTLAASEYIRTTTVPLYDLPYDWTGTYYYPLCEPAATNVGTFSRTWPVHANYTSTNITRTQKTGFDGIANSTYAFEATGGNASIRCPDLESMTNGTTYTRSYFVKRLAGSGPVYVAPNGTYGWKGDGTETVTGSSLITNGDFATDVSGWTVTGTQDGSNYFVWNAGGYADFAATGSLSAKQVASGTTPGKVYRIAVTVTIASGTLRLSSNAGGGVVISTSGTYYILTMRDGLTDVAAHFARASGTIVCTIDNVEIKEVTSINCDVSSQLVLNEWVRVSSPSFVSHGGSTARVFVIATSGDKIAVDQHQIETGIVATSPIITAGATVTRAADALSELLSTIPSLGSAYTLAVKYRPRSAAIENRALRVDDGTANEVVAIGNTSGGNGSAWVVDGGAAQTAPLTDGAVTSGAANRVAVSVEANNIRMSVNGAAVVSDTSATLPSPTTLRFMPVGAGHIESLIVLPHATSDDTALRGLLA